MRNFIYTYDEVICKSKLHSMLVYTAPKHLANKPSILRHVYPIIIIILTLSSTILQGQGVSQVEYGKNRVQYHRDFDEWMKYESDNFITYWYGDARNIGQAAVQIAEKDFRSIQNMLEHRINERIQIIVYTDITDLKMSNIGVEEAFTNTGGQTKIVGNKVFVYFDGNHNNLRRQIREGVADVYLNAMLFGSNLQEIVQNAVMLNLPEWFKQGLVAYVGESWSTELDNQLRDFMLSDEFEGFDRLAEENPKLAGHALWHYIGENYGHSTVSNLLYLTRINRSVESGFLYVLGNSYNMVLDSWAIFFKERYKAEHKERNAPESRKLKFKNKRKLPISQVKISPNGQQVVYVANEIGKYKVYLQNIGTGDREVIFKAGFRNAFQATDYNYPLIAWNPSGLEVAILYERRDIVKLMNYDIHTKKSKTEDLSSQYQRIYSMDFVNPNALVFSAAVRGFSDLYLYYLSTRQSERLTNDFYDDFDATVVKIDNRKGILFSSNRQDSMLAPMRLDTILPLNTFDIFYYDLEDRSQELVRVTNTPLANERKPVAIDSTYFSYLSDISGIYNREAAYLEEYIHHYNQLITLDDGTEIVLHIDSSLAKLDTTLIDTIIIQPVIKKRAISHPISNYRRNIIEQHTAPRAGRTVEMLMENQEHVIYFPNIKIDTLIQPLLTRYQQSKFAQAQKALLKIGSNDQQPSLPTQIRPNQPKLVEKEKVDSVPTTKEPKEKIAVSPPKDTTKKVDIDNYLFQSEFDDEEVPAKVTIKEKKEEQQSKEKQEDKEQKQEETIVIEQPNLRNSKNPNKKNPSQQPEVYRFRPGKIVPYRLTFRTDYVTTQLDNSLLFQGLESYVANPQGFDYPPPGILLKANFKDLFEDHEFEGGVRIPTTFNGTEYFLTYTDKKKRLDKHFAIYRRNQKFSEESQTFATGKREINVLLGQFGIRYPLDIFRSLRATFTLRRDRSMRLATDRAALETAPIKEQRAGVKLEYVFDNTLDVGINLRHGTRYKIYAEWIKRFNLDITNDFSLSFNNGNLGVIGIDARHYQRLDKNSIFAVRLAGATSFGSEKILYFLGGVDNWLFTRFNDDIPIPQNGNFAYQTLAANLRGFDLNIRNGNSYALINAELRVPIFKYISRRIKSSFFRNFQVVGFFDIGTAWQGANPFDDDNPLNTSFFPENDPNPLVIARVNFFRDPIVAGYGVGVRTMLFGYFLKLDYAWGIETSQVQDPKLYVSLGLDF